MGTFLICLLGIALCCVGVMITFKILKFLRRRIKNDKLNLWLTPVISGILGGACIVAVIVLIVLAYNEIDFLRSYVDAIANLV